MRHKFLVLPVKKWLKSVHIYGSYRKIITGVPFFLDHPVYIFTRSVNMLLLLRCMAVNSNDDRIEIESGVGRGVYPYLPMAPMRHGQFLGGIYFY